MPIGIFDFAGIFVISDAGIARFDSAAHPATLFFTENIAVVPSAPRIGPRRVGTHPRHAIGTANFTRVFVIAYPGIAFFRRWCWYRCWRWRWCWYRCWRWCWYRCWRWRWYRCWRWCWYRCWRWRWRRIYNRRWRLIVVGRRLKEQHPCDNAKNDENNASDDRPKCPRRPP